MLEKMKAQNPHWKGTKHSGWDEGVEFCYKEMIGRIEKLEAQHRKTAWGIVDWLHKCSGNFNVFEHRWAIGMVAIDLENALQAAGHERPEEV